MSRRPNFEDLDARARGCYQVLCRCGSGLRCQQDLFDHWQRGHFDVFENEEPRAKWAAVGLTDADREFVDRVPVAQASGPLRSLIDEIRSGVTELEGEVNRFELSRDAANDDVAKAVDDASAELVFTLARLRVAVREIARRAER